jgi:hypothetical protein
MKLLPIQSCKECNRVLFKGLNSKVLHYCHHPKVRGLHPKDNFIDWTVDKILPICPLQDAEKESE